MTIALTFTVLALMALAVFAGAFLYAALTCSLTGADISDAAEYHHIVARAFKAPVAACIVKPAQAPRTIVAYRVPSVGAPLTLTYIHAQ